MNSLQKNRRKHFRTPIFSKDCLIKDNFKTSPAESREVSSGGMSLLVDYDVFNEFVEVRFKVGESEFIRFARVLRRRREPSGKTLYSLQFLNYTEQERGKLNSSIFRIEALNLRNKEN